MKQISICLLMAAMLASAATAAAQTTFRFGLRGGANRALTTVDAAGTSSGNYPFSYSTSKSALYAWQAGVVFEAGFGKLAFQPALLFSQKGEQRQTSFYMSGVAGYTSSQTTGTNRYNWLELPLNLVYTMHTDHGLQFFGGPYVALAVGGCQRGTTTTVSYYGPAIDPIFTQPVDFNNQTTYGSGTNNRRLDVGVNFGIGYRQGPVQLQLGYGLGLRNLHQATELDYGHDFNADAAYNRVAQLTGTYFFSL